VTPADCGNGAVGWLLQGACTGPTGRRATPSWSVWCSGGARAGTALVDAEEEREVLSAQEWMNVVTASQVAKDLMTGRVG